MIDLIRTSKKELTFIILAWICIHVFLFYQQGIGIGLEAKKYIGAAAYLLEHGSFPEKKYLFYALTPLLIAICSKLGLGYTGAVVIQSVISLFSMLIFFRLCFLLFRNKFIAVATTVIFLVFFPYQSWNTYLYTESIFLSAVIFFIYSIYRISNKKNNKTADYFLLLLTTSLVVTARPFGMLFLPPLVLFLLLRLPKRFFLLSVMIVIVTGALMYYFLNRAFSGSADWNSMVSNINGNIICDIPNKNYIERLDLAEKGDPVAQLFYYVTHNTRHFLRLSAARLAAFFNLTRSYYSSPHNMCLVLFMIVIYGFLIAGIKEFNKKVQRDFKVFIYSGIIVYALSITLQCDDYHNRFIMALIPFFLLITGFGLERFVSVLKYIQRRKGSI